MAPGCGVPTHDPRHLALLAVHNLVAVCKGLTLPHEKDLLAHLVAAWQRRQSTCGGISYTCSAAVRRRHAAAHLRTPVSRLGLELGHQSLRR